MGIHCRDLTEALASEVEALLSSVDTILCDCDGVLYKGKNAIPGSPEAYAYLTGKLNKKLIFVTNGSTRTREEYIKKLTSLGFSGVKWVTGRMN